MTKLSPTMQRALSIATPHGLYLSDRLSPNSAWSPIRGMPYSSVSDATVRALIKRGLLVVTKSYGETAQIPCEVKPIDTNP